MRKRLAAVWNDPVWSKVIASSIGVAGVAAWAWAVPRLHRFSSTLVFVTVGGTVLAALGLAMLWSRFRPSKKTLVFVSSGGTCRDPMAKAIMMKLLAARKPRPRIQVRAAALGPISKTEVSYAARYTIRDMYGDDLLKDHRPELLTSELADEADLILVMDRSLLGKTLARDKTYVVKEFFDLEGDIGDPWPDGRDATTLNRYKECGEELRTLLTKHFDKIVSALAV